MAFLANIPGNITVQCQKQVLLPLSTQGITSSVMINCAPKRLFARQQTSVSMCSASGVSSVQSLEQTSSIDSFGVPIMVNGATGKMGRAVLEAADAAGLYLVPVAFGGPEDSGKTIQVGGKEIKLHASSERENILSSIYSEYPNLVLVDYTVPSAVNENAELYASVGVPFVMGTTGGDREKLFKTVKDSNVYAVLSPQMGKQVVAFLAAMEIMAEQFPGAFSGYSLQVIDFLKNFVGAYEVPPLVVYMTFNIEVMESHQASKKDTSGTAKAVISCFQKLGVSFEEDQIQQIRDPKLQREVVGVPDEYLAGHAFHMYNLTSPDGTVSFEFQHNVCGRSIYAEGTVDAVLFLSKKVQSKAEKRIYDMIDVLREGNMR